MRAWLSFGILVSVICLAPAPGFAGPRRVEQRTAAQQQQSTAQQQQQTPPATTPQETPAAQGRGAGRADNPQRPGRHQLEQLDTVEP